MPPGRASSSALRPFHCTIFSGSTKNSNTVSGRAAILISRSTTVATSGGSTATSPPSLFEFGRVLQTLEAFVPERFEKRPQIGEALGTKPVEPPRPFSPLRHEPRLAQDAQVLRHGRSRDLEAGGDLPGGKLVRADEGEDAPAVWFGDRPEGFFH